MSDLYDTDILLWSEQQAGLLRRRALGMLTNDTELDWTNIAEEIESVGSEQRHAVESLLIQALRHWLKTLAWPHSGEVPHWQAEERLFRSLARRRFVPSMRQRIDFDRLYRDALRSLPDTIDGQPPLPVPVDCRVTLDGLLSED
jgi:hypothetical protein